MVWVKPLSTCGRNGEKLEDFENYGQDPERLPGAEFEEIFADCIDGVPREIFPEIMEV